MVSFKKRTFKVGITVSVSISKTDAILFYWLFAVSHGNILHVLTFRPVRSPVSNSQYKKRRSYVTENETRFAIGDDSETFAFTKDTGFPFHIKIFSEIMYSVFMI